MRRHIPTLLAPLLLLGAASCTAPHTQWRVEDVWTDLPPEIVDEEIPAIPAENLLPS